MYYFVIISFLALHPHWDDDGDDDDYDIDDDCYCYHLTRLAPRL